VLDLGCFFRCLFAGAMTFFPLNATPEMLLLAARTSAALNDLPATEAFLRRAIETDSTLLPAYAMLGQLYLSQKKVDDARVEFEKLAARQTNPVAALIFGLRWRSPSAARTAP
jgi:tetratricopeptide (TPR) repeat protein